MDDEQSGRRHAPVLLLPGCELNCRRYGRLYTWQAAQEGCRSLGKEWRLPTNDEWRQMTKPYGGVRDDSHDTGTGAYQALLIGGRSGFNALLGGNRSEDGRYARCRRTGSTGRRQRVAPPARGTTISAKAACLSIVIVMATSGWRLPYGASGTDGVLSRLSNGRVLVSGASVSAGRVSDDVPEHDHAERNAEHPSDDITHKRPSASDLASGAPCVSVVESARERCGACRCSHELSLRCQPATRRSTRRGGGADRGQAIAAAA